MDLLPLGGIFRTFPFEVVSRRVEKSFAFYDHFVDFGIVQVKIHAIVGGLPSTKRTVE